MEPWQRLLCDSLAVLALPPDEQVRVNGPGCVACDLLNDFDHARRVALDNAPDLSDTNRNLLDRINFAMDSMQQQDCECFNNDVLHRPVWQELRKLATETLRSFHWVRIEVQPSSEGQPGIWHRPHAEVEPSGQPEPPMTRDVES